MAINFKGTGAIIIYSIATIGILAIIGYNYWGWFGGKSTNGNMNNIPPRFKMPHCGGTAPIGETEYYMESGKYYSHFTSNNPLAGYALALPVEISKEDYSIAYKQSKEPCDPMLQRVNQSVPNENNPIERTAPSDENARMANKPKWVFNSISAHIPYTAGWIVLNGTSKISTDFIGGQNIIITNKDTNQTLDAQIVQIFPILPSIKNIISQKVLVRLTGNMIPPNTIKGWIEISPNQ